MYVEWCVWEAQLHRADSHGLHPGSIQHPFQTCPSLHARLKQDSVCVLAKEPIRSKNTNGRWCSIALVVVQRAAAGAWACIV